MDRNEYIKQWRESHPSFCIDCGIKISYYSNRCRSCGLKERYKGLPQHGKERAAQRQKERRLAKQKPCVYCDKPTYSPSQTCSLCAITKKRISYNTKTGRGWNWKGGSVNYNGYTYIYKPDHPSATELGYVREHLLVWEQINNKTLPKGWHIHHLNGIKHDNRPANLIALTSKKHFLVLQAMSKRIQELEALLNHQHHLL